jgi:hypothetical protein
MFILSANWKKSLGNRGHSTNYEVKGGRENFDN